MTPEYAEWIESRQRRQEPLPIDRGSIVGRVGLERGIVHVHDLRSDPEYARRQAVALGGLRTVNGVPLLREASI